MKTDIGEFSMRAWKLIRGLFLLLAIAGLVSCSGGEAKRAKFMAQGQAHYEAGDYVAARLDVKNALQIDPKFGQGYLLLGKTELKLKNFKGAYQALSNATKYAPENMEAQLELGRLLLGGRQADKAIEKADLVLARDGGHVEAKVLKASALLLDKKPAEAIALLEKTVSTELKVPQAFSVLAMCYFQTKDVEKGRQILLEGIGANPEAVSLRLLLARVEAGRKDLDAAAMQLQTAIKLQPDNRMLPYQLADLYWAFHQVDRAKTIVHAQVDSQAGNEEALLQAAGFLVGKNELQEAETLLDRGIAGIPGSFKLRFALNDVLVKKKETDKALAVLKECLTLSKDSEHPDIVTTRLTIARLHLLLHDVPAARSEIEQVLHVSPKNIEGRFLLGQILIAEGKASEAVPEFRMVISEKPDLMPAYLILARVHLIEKQPELAMDTLGKALEVNPDAPEILQAMAMLRTRNKDYAGAENNLRRILQKTPDDLRTQVQLGDLLFYTKDFARAEMEYKRLVRVDARNPVGYIRLGRLHAQQQQWAAAEKILRQGHGVNPDVPILLTSLVQVLQKDNRIDAAEELCRNEVRRRPDRAFGYAILGQLLAQKKQYAAAEAQLRKAIEIEPVWQTPYNVLAQLYMSQGKQGEAIRELETLKKADPANIRTYSSLALLYEKNGDHVKAIDMYRQLLARQPDFWPAANNLAFLLSERHSDAKELDEALTLAMKANRLRPEDATILDTLGWVHYRRGELEQALVALEEALEKNHDSAEMNYHAAVVLHASGRVEEAREKLDTALRDDDFTDRAAAEKLNALIAGQKN